jgi:5-formyltetrahydrofolate cyclo-ligase
MQPSQIRRQMRAQRQQLTPLTLQQHSQQLCRLACNFKPFRHSRRIAFYIASRGEIDPAPLMELAFKAGKQVYLPILRHRPSRGLWFASHHPEGRLALNRYKIPEPVAHHRRIVMPWSIDMVFVPLVAFDKRGNRLGMGGGFYDRTFAFKQRRNHWCGPSLIGLAHDFQCVDQLLNQTWDIPLDAVITERTIYLFQQKTGC